MSAGEMMTLVATRIVGEANETLRNATNAMNHATARIAELEAELAEARRVTDEKVERAAQVLWGGGAHDTPWRERYGAWQHDDLFALARHALTAALGGGS